MGDNERHLESDKKRNQEKTSEEDESEGGVKEGEYKRVYDKSELEAEKVLERGV